MPIWQIPQKFFLLSPRSPPPPYPSFFPSSPTLLHPLQNHQGHTPPPPQSGNPGRQQGAKFQGGVEEPAAHLCQPSRWKLGVTGSSPGSAEAPGRSLTHLLPQRRRRGVPHPPRPSSRGQFPSLPMPFWVIFRTRLIQQVLTECFLRPACSHASLCAEMNPSWMLPDMTRRRWPSPKKGRVHHCGAPLGFRG